MSHSSHIETYRVCSFPSLKINFFGLGLLCNIPYKEMRCTERKICRPWGVRYWAWSFYIYETHNILGAAPNIVKCGLTCRSNFLFGPSPIPESLSFRKVGVDNATYTRLSIGLIDFHSPIIPNIPHQKYFNMRTSNLIAQYPRSTSNKSDTELTRHRTETWLPEIRVSTSNLSTRYKGSVQNVLHNLYKL